MEGKKRKNVRLYQPKVPQFTATEKDGMLEKVKTLIQQLPKVSSSVSRMAMRANRIYLYKLVEQRMLTYITEPLIDGKYLEFPYARLTLNDTQGKNCTVDWQRHNEQWILVYTGTLSECLIYIEKDEVWF